MDVAAGDADVGGRRIEGLDGVIVEVAAVHRVGIVGAEGLDIEAVNAAADLLVGGKGDLEGAVGRAGGEELLQRRHDLSYAGLVVSPQQGGAVGDDETLPLVFLQVGEFSARQHIAVPQLDIAAVIGCDNTRLDVLAGQVG